MLLSLVKILLYRVVRSITMLYFEALKGLPTAKRSARTLQVSWVLSVPL